MSFKITVRGSRGLMATEFACSEHGVFAVDITGDHDAFPCPECSSPSPWQMSAPMTRVKRGEVSRGKSDQHLPHQLDTRPLADGMPYDEWSKRYDNMDRDIRWKQNKKRVA